MSQTMVTITLDEYRSLVEKATINKYELDKWKAEQKINELEKTIQCLKNKIWEQANEEVMGKKKEEL